MRSAFLALLWLVAGSAPSWAQVAATTSAAASRPATTASAVDLAAPGDDRVVMLGRLNHPPIQESSGIVASRTQPGVFWTHNDSGNPPVLYAVQRDGTLLGEYPVRAANRDWEDIAIDDAGHLYIGEIGNNGGRYNELAVYRVVEPILDRSLAATARRPPLRVDRIWKLHFAGQPFDCEALFVWRDWGYVISKQFDGQDATMWRFPLVDQPQRPATLEKVTALPIRWPVTAADISGDGRLLAVMSVAGPFVFRIDGEVARAGQVTPSHIRYMHPKIEACCFVPEGLLATTEERDMLLFTGHGFLSGVGEKASNWPLGWSWHAPTTQEE